MFPHHLFRKVHFLGRIVEVSSTLSQKVIREIRDRHPAITREYETGEDMAGQRVEYRRRNSSGQNLDRQEIEGCHRVFEESASGGSRDKRPALAEMIAYVREGDEVIVHSIDRLARSLQDLQGIVDELTGKGVRVRFLKEGLTFGGSAEDPTRKLMLQLLGSIEGIAAARKRKGYRHGRKPTVDPQTIIGAWVTTASASLKDIAGKVGCSRSTVHRIHTSLSGDRVGRELDALLRSAATPAWWSATAAQN
jgi:DNA invertase Pin-like site-specific DNA recombinase